MAHDLSWMTLVNTLGRVITETFMKCRSEVDHDNHEDTTCVHDENWVLMTVVRMALKSEVVNQCGWLYKLAVVVVVMAAAIGHSRSRRCRRRCRSRSRNRRSSNSSSRRSSRSSGRSRSRGSTGSSSSSSRSRSWGGRVGSVGAGWGGGG